MDPDQIAQLNDAIRGLADTIGQSSAAISKQTQATGTSTTGINTNSKAQTAAAVSATAMSNAQKNAEAEANASAAATKRLKDALDQGKDAVKSFAGALLDVTPGLSKYASTVNSASGAVSNLVSGLGPLGAVAGVLVKAFGGLAGAALKYQDSIISGFDDMAKVGGGARLSAEKIMELGTASGFTSGTLSVFTKHASDASKQLVSMSGSVSGGMEAYSKFTAVGDVQLKKYRQLGMTQDDLIDAQTTYLRQQSEAGQSLKKSPEQLQKASLAYIDNLNVLSDLTGISIKDQQKAQEIAFANANFNAFLTSLDQKEADLRAQAIKEGDTARGKELVAKADEIAAVKAAKEEYGRMATATMSAANSAGVLEAISTEGTAVWTESNAHVLRLMGDQVAAHNENMNKGKNATAEFTQAYAQGTRRTMDEFKEGLTSFGKSTRDLQAITGVDNEARANLAKNNDLMTKEGLENWRKREADEKARIAALGKGKGPEDTMKKQAELEAEERKTRAAADKALKEFGSFIQGELIRTMKWLNNTIDWTVKNLNNIITVGKALAASLAVLTVGGAILKALGGGFGKAGSMGNPLYVKSADGPFGPGGGKGGKGPKGGGPKLGKDGRWRSESGKFLSKAEGEAAEMAQKKGAGFLGKIGLKGAAKAGARFIPGVGFLAAGAMAAGQGYAGYKDANENLGIKGREATTGEKWSSAAGGALSSLTMGIVDPATLSKAIAGISGAGPKSAEETAAAAKKAAAANTAAAKATDKLKKDEETRAKAQAKHLKKINEAMNAGTEATKNQANASNATADSMKGLKDGFTNFAGMLGPTGIIAASIMGLATIGSSGESPGSAPGNKPGLVESGLRGLADLGAKLGGAVMNTGADMKKYLATIGLIESGGKADAKAGTSSAGGLFQFTKGTWKGLTKQMGVDFSEEDRFDPVKATQVAAFMATQQKKSLEKKTGRAVTNTDLYMAHFLGEGGASKFLRAMGENPNANAAEVVGTQAANANKNIFFDKSGKARSLQEVYGLMNQKVGGASKAVETGKWGGKALPSTIAALAGPQSGSSPSTAPSTPADVTTKITKAPEAAVAAASTEAASTASTASTSATQTASLNFDTMNMLSQKLDTMINLLESSNSTQDKLLRYSQV